MMKIHCWDENSLFWWKLVLVMKNLLCWWMFIIVMKFYPSDENLSQLRNFSFQWKLSFLIKMKINHCYKKIIILMKIQILVDSSSLRLLFIIVMKTFRWKLLTGMKIQNSMKIHQRDDHLSFFTVIKIQNSDKM